MMTVAQVLLLVATITQLDSTPVNQPQNRAPLIQVQDLRDRSIPHVAARGLVMLVVGQPTLAQGQTFAQSYAAGLQIKNGMLIDDALVGYYFVHKNNGILPGTGDPGQPAAVLAREEDGWISTETARSLLEAGGAVSPAIETAKAFIRNRSKTTTLDVPPITFYAPPTFWVDPISGKTIGTSKVDAQNSSLGSFLRLVGAIYKAAPNDTSVKAFLSKNRSAILNVAYNLVLQNDPADGLFWTYSPTYLNYKMKLLAGDSESVAGLFAIADISANYYKDTPTANYYRSFAINGQAAILREYYKANAIGKWRISKDQYGVFGELTTAPNWDKFDLFLTYVINCNIVSPTSPQAVDIMNFLFERFPNVLTQRPSTALDFTPEFGLALVKVGRKPEARIYAQTVVNAEFPLSDSIPYGYFTNRSVAQLVLLLNQTK